MYSVDLLVQVLPLAVAAMFTPTLLALQLLVVAESPWVRRAIAVAVANAVAFGLVIGIVLAGFAQLPDQGTGELGPLDRWLRVICGVVLLLMSVFFLWPHPQMSARAQASLERRAKDASVWVFFGLAFYFSITDLSSFLVLIPALHDVTVSRADLIAKVGVVSIILVIALSTTWLPPVLRGVWGRQVEPTLDRLYRFVMRNQFPIVGVICLLFGVYLIVTGTTGRH